MPSATGPSRQRRVLTVGEFMMRVANGLDLGSIERMGIADGESQRLIRTIKYVFRSTSMC